MAPRATADADADNTNDSARDKEGAAENTAQADLANAAAASEGDNACEDVRCAVSEGKEGDAGDGRG